MEEQKSVQQQFLSDLDIKEVNPLDVPLEIPEATPAKEEPKEEDGFNAKNRRERRLLEQNQRLREEAIAASARAQALSEVNKFREEAGATDYIKEVRAIYGDDEPQKKVASDILENTLRKIEENAVQKAFDRLNSQRTEEDEETKKEESNLDTILDHVEDEHGIDMSGDDRVGYLTLLEKLSPKDNNGNIIEYADADTTAEIFLERKNKSNDRAKGLASRSMTQSGASGDSKLDEDATWRFLKENGF